jgi:hypothetical protein
MAGTGLATDEVQPVQVLAVEAVHPRSGISGNDSRKQSSANPVGTPTSMIIQRRA